jgi:hypothetical protein
MSGVWRAGVRRVIVVTMLVAAFAAGASSASAINVEVLNSSGRPSSSIYLMLQGGGSSDGQLPSETPEPLSQLKGQTFSLGSISGGRLYVSYGAPVKTNEPPTAPTRYDKIELTNPGVADVTAVDFFGIPFDLQSLDTSGATVGDALGYRCFTSTLVPRLRSIGPAAEVSEGGQFVRFLSPQLAAEGSYPSLAPYVESMVGKTVEVNDVFGHEKEPAKSIIYKGTFEPGGSITLTGTITSPHAPLTPGLPVRIEGATLPSAVYTGDGAYTVGGEAADVSQNNEYSVIYRDLVAGFGLGYWGGRYGNNSASWMHQPNFAAAWPVAPPFTAWSLYASTIAEYAPVYGYAFSELGPAEITAPLEASVATLRVTIDPDQGPSTPGCQGESTPARGGSAPPGSAPGSRGGGRPGSGIAPVGQVKVTIDSSRAMLEKRGRALLQLSCSGDPCKGELTLARAVQATTKRTRRGGGRHSARASRSARHGQSKAQRVAVLGRVAFSIEEGKSQRVWVTIAKAGRSAITAAKGHKLTVLAEASVGPTAKATIVARRAITLEGYRPKVHGRR